MELKPIVELAATVCKVWQWGYHSMVEQRIEDTVVIGYRHQYEECMTVKIFKQFN